MVDLYNPLPTHPEILIVALFPFYINTPIQSTQHGDYRDNHPATEKRRQK